MIHILIYVQSQKQHHTFGYISIFNGIDDDAGPISPEFQLESDSSGTQIKQIAYRSLNLLEGLAVPGEGLAQPPGDFVQK